MDPQIKRYFRTLKCPAPTEPVGTLTWTHSSLFNTPETAQIEWSESEMKVSGQMDNTHWCLVLRKPDPTEGKARTSEWDIVQAEGLSGGTPRAKLWRAREFLSTIRELAPAPDQGWVTTPARKGFRP